MEFGKVSEKGGITIPKKIRELKGIHPNDHLYFAMMEDGRIVFDKINYKLLDSNANKNYQLDKTENEEKKMEISEGGEERTQTEGGAKYEQLDKSGRSPQETQSDTLRLHDKQNKPQRADTTGTPDQKREKKRINEIGGEQPYERENKEDRNR